MNDSGDPHPLASAEEIHAYLVERLNLALRGPEMFGGEIALQILMNHLLMAEREPDPIGRLRSTWQERGAWTSLGVTGAFRELVPKPKYNCGMASVYAEFAQARGWLRPDRTLASDAYRAMVDQVRDWVGEDRTWADVTDRFGPPSVLFGGSNPLYSKSLGYLADDPALPMVVFHLWNGTEPGPGDGWPPAHEQPLLLAVRHGHGPFPGTFTFTPHGHRLRPPALEQAWLA
ncbi:hypothetical protein AB0F07_38285 [Streptomyces fructofermentans]|uniref:hypothetical protein n=1 Tax=Streptomyces fructofermentans TaxID=152141 RepID=UPI0034052C44